ncbi:Hypothetical predicted protein, partial [Pelobates cultripes]
WTDVCDSLSDWGVMHTLPRAHRRLGSKSGAAKGGSRWDNMERRSQCTTRREAVAPRTCSSGGLEDGHTVGATNTFVRTSHQHPIQSWSMLA